MRSLSLLALLLAAPGCSGAEAPGPSGPSRHVLVVGIDGARPDALQAADTPALDGLIAQGAASFDARTQLTGDTLSGPGWVSVLTGLEVETHGVLGNAAMGIRDKSLRSFVWRTRQELGRETLVAHGWNGIGLALEDDAATTRFGELGRTTPDDDVVAAAEDALPTLDLGLAFVHLDEVDHEGHTTGFSPENPAYVAALEAADARLGRLLAAVDARPRRAREDWLVVVTTDHSGEGNGHSGGTEHLRTIFLVVSGPGVTPGGIEAASHLDVAPTVLDYLGGAVEPAWALVGTSRAP